MRVCLICGRELTDDDEFALFMGVTAELGYRTFAPVVFLCPDCLFRNEGRFYQMKTSDIMDLSGGPIVVELEMS